MKNANDQNFFNFVEGLDKGLYGIIIFKNYDLIESNEYIYLFVQACPNFWQVLYS